MTPEERNDAIDANDGRADDAPQGVTRRRALKVLAAGAAGAAALPAAACAPGGDPPSAGADRASGGEDGGPANPGAANPLAAGTQADPDLISPVVPWDLVLTEGELETLAALCDVIIPRDERSPSASAVGAHEFIDEWVSAPYDANRDDLTRIRGGIAWLEVESDARFQARFPALTIGQQHEICDDIRYLPDAGRSYRSAAKFFDRVRDLTSSAFWTTEEGMSDLGFVGNRPMPAFEGPPREVLERLGLI
ncbi:MAG: gluconate 2-dehydrogenase subunit 3 family protein [Gemmatimonadota bacterium]